MDAQPNKTKTKTKDTLMKFKIFALFSAIAAFALFSVSCEKIDQNPEYPFVIVVKTVDDSTIVQNAYVEVGVPSQINSELAFEGFTNSDGQASFKYDNDAVFRVRATRGNDPITYIGCTYVRLEPNQTVYRTVYMEPWDDQSPGCDLIFQ